MPEIDLWKPGIKYLGLVVAGGKDTAPPGSLRRNTGIHRIYDGVLRSRPGSEAHANSTNGATRPVVFDGNLYYIKSGNLYRNGSAIDSSGVYGEVSYARMPVNIGKVDYLFVAGVSPMVKVSAAGVVSNWGIKAPTSNFSAADGGAGSLAAGTYLYHVVYGNSTTNSISNSNPSSVSVTVGATRQVSLTNIPISPDSQVDQRRIYRTTAGGSLFFFLATIANNTATTYTDTGGTALSATQLQTDNTPVEAGTGVIFGDAVGPFAGRMWFARHSAFLADIYFSPIGRPESLGGSLTVSTTDEAVVKLVIWNGLWAFTTRTIRQIVSTTAAPLEVRGAPGIPNESTGRHFVQATPQGIIYIAADGPRIFDGSTSRLLSRQALGLFFRDAALTPELNAGAGFLESTFARDEYILSNASTAIAFNVQEQTWRDLGLAARGLAYDFNTDTVYVTTFGASGKILKFEKDDETDDDGDSIPFDVEFPSLRPHIYTRGLVQFLRFDIDTDERDVTPKIILDGTETSLTTFNTNGRTKVEIPVLKIGRVIGVRLTGADEAGQITLYGASIEVYVPKGR